MAEMIAPTSELGYMNGTGTDWQQWDQFEQVPDLQWPKSVGVFTRMAREDGRVSSVLAAIGLPIRRTPWRIAPNGARDEVVEFVARELGLPIYGADPNELKGRTRDRFSWAQHLQEALLMLQFGHSYFEQVYRIGDDGYAHLRKLASRPQATLSQIHVDLDGGLLGIAQHPPTMMSTDPNVQRRIAEYDARNGAFDFIPVNRLVGYLRDPDPGVWLGRSLLRPAYKHWLMKDQLMRIQAVAAQRNGIGVPVVIAPPNADKSDPELKGYQKLASSFRGGPHSGAALANGGDMKLLGVQGNLPDIQQAIDYQDKQIALAGLAHFLNLDGKGGSYALASVQENTFTQSVQSVAEMIQDTAQAHIVEDLVDLNFGPDEDVPLLVFDEIGSRQDATAAALQMLIAAGIIAPDPTLEAYERQTLGLPAADPVEDDTPNPVPPAPVPADPAADPNADPQNKYRTRRVRSRRVTVEPNGAMTLW